jgi:hypothetical protein
MSSQNPFGQFDHSAILRKNAIPPPRPNLLSHLEPLRGPMSMSEFQDRFRPAPTHIGPPPDLRPFRDAFASRMSASRPF